MTRAEIRLSKDLTLPPDAVTQTFAWLARKGGGKTYAASLAAEQMLGFGAQVVVIDPVGTWYGLRLAADGKGKGKEIYVIGGDHGDVPLVPDAGARIAKLLVEKRISAVIDVSGFRKADRKRFAADFAEELFHLKKAQRSPMHLFLEESHKLVPQRPMGDEAVMLGAFEDIVRLGRNYGIGASLIDQRPQSVNKEVLSQVECLVCLQINGTHERKAIEDWVQEAGADRKLVGELPKLAVGEAYVWSPSWLRVFKRVHIGKKITFDASATPKVGHKQIAPGKLTPMDVEALRADMAEVVAKAEQDNPKALRAKIASLERELATRKPETKTVEVPAVSKKDMAGIREAVKEMDKALSKITSVHEAWRHNLTEVGVRLDGLKAAMQRVSGETAIKLPAKAAVSLTGTMPACVPPSLADKFPAPVKSVSGPLRSGAKRILRELAARHPAIYTRAQVATLTGFSPNGGTFNTYLSDLRRAGYIEESGNTMRATESGIQSLGGDVATAPADRAAVMAMWKNALRAGAYRMLEVVVGYGEIGTDRHTLAGNVGMEVSGGTFNTYLSDLRRNGLIEESNGIITASDMLA